MDSFDKITRKVACVVDIALGLFMFLLVYGMWACWYEPIMLFWNISAPDLAVGFVILGAVGSVASVWMGIDFIRSGIRRYKKERNTK